MPGANPFHAVAALGYSSLLPIVPPGAPLSPNSTLAARAGKPGKDPRGKAPGILKADGFWSGYDWMRQAPATALDCERWHGWGASVGLRMGDGLVGLDADTMDPGLAATALRITCETIPGAHAVRVGRSPKFLILLRVPTHVPYRMIEFVAPGDDPRKSSRIELLSRGKQAVVAGIHPGTGKPYTWQPAMPRLTEVIETTPEALALLFSRLADAMPGAPAQRIEGGSTGAETPQAQLRGNADAVRRAIEKLPNTTAHFPTRESYRDVGYALKAALPDDDALAFSFFEAWSDRWEDPPDGEGNVDGYADAMWRTLRPPFRIGAPWLYERLEATTGTPAGSAWLEPIEPPPAGSLFDLQPREPGPAALLELVTFHEAADRALSVGNKPLIKGLLDRGAFSVFYGPSGQYKTFIVMELALYVALGRDFAGKRIKQAVPALYVAGEGAVGANKRAAALRKVYEIPRDQDVPFFFRMSSLDLFHADADLRPLIATIRSIPGLGLVVLDTLSRVMSGGDENAPTDMGALVRNLDLIRKETGAHVLAVHHTGKDVAKGARGHSLLRAATDTEVEINEGVFEVTKQREIETTLKLAFAPTVVTLGTDEDGETITSCVMSFSSVEEAAKEKLAQVVFAPPTETEQLVLEAIRDVASVSPTYVATNEAILEWLKSRGQKKTYDGIRKLQEKLLKKGLIVGRGRGKWGVSDPILGQSQTQSQTFGGLTYSFGTGPNVTETECDFFR